MRTLGLAISNRVLVGAALVMAACNDAPGAASGPGNLVINQTNEPEAGEAGAAGDAGVDATASADGGPDGGMLIYDGATDSLASFGYGDVQSPMAACAACTCGKTTGFCMENVATATVSGTGTAGQCPLASGGLAIGCNPLPASCQAAPTCSCILAALQPPLPCYPECTTGNGYFDVFCSHP